MNVNVELNTTYYFFLKLRTAAAFASYKTEKYIFLLHYYI